MLKIFVMAKLKDFNGTLDNICEKSLIFEIFFIFTNVQTDLMKSEFVSYDYDQVVKKHLNLSKNSLAFTIWARARLRTLGAPKCMSLEKRIFT